MEGAEVLFAAARIARDEGIPMTVRSACPQVRGTLHAIGLDRLLRYRDE
ncbi:hypothetical protein [Actinacidiphila glaucinigra]